MAEKIFVFALSTCGWCKKTIGWLDDNGVNFEKLYVDQLQGDPRDKAVEDLRKYNPDLTFPTVVIDDGATVIVGFKEDQLKEKLLS